jgi:hypothetical protein
LTSKERMDSAIAAVKRPSRLMDERIVSFGAGKPYLAVGLQPTVVRGFDMFMIRVEERQREPTLNAIKWRGAIRIGR